MHSLFRDRTTNYIFWGGLLLLVVSLTLLITGNANQQVKGEAFYDLHYADRYSVGESWKEYFLSRDRARLGAAFYFSTIYELVDYNPPLLYYSGFLLIIATVILQTIILKERVPGWVIIFALVLLTFVPINITNLFSLKKAHHILSWFALATSIVFWWNWIRTRKWSWLLFSFFAYLAGLLSYESTFAIFPVAVLLYNSDNPSVRKTVTNTLIAGAFCILGAVTVFGVELARTGSNVINFYGNTTGLGDYARLLFVNLPVAIWDGGLFSLLWQPPMFIIYIYRALLMLTCLIALVGTAWSLKARIQNVWSNSVSLVFIGMWLIFAGYLPFILAKQPPDNDGLHGAMLGISILAIAAAMFIDQIIKKRGLAILFLSCFCLFWVFTGVASYGSAIIWANKNDAVITTFVVSMREAIPNIREGTEFVFINSSIGRNACTGAINMIYAKHKLHCIHLKDNDTEETYTWLNNRLVSDAGTEHTNQLVLIRINPGGHITLLDAIDESQYPFLPVTWESHESISTDYSAIINSPGPITPIFRYSLELFEGDEKIE